MVNFSDFSHFELLRFAKRRPFSREQVHGLHLLQRPKHQAVNGVVARLIEVVHDCLNLRIELTLLNGNGVREPFVIVE